MSWVLLASAMLCGGLRCRLAFDSAAEVCGRDDGGLLWAKLGGHASFGPGVRPDVLTACRDRVPAASLYSKHVAALTLRQLRAWPTRRWCARGSRPGLALLPRSPTARGAPAARILACFVAAAPLCRFVGFAVCCRQDSPSILLLCVWTLIQGAVWGQGTEPGSLLDCTAAQP